MNSLKPVIPFKVVIRSYRERTYIVEARTSEEAIASVELEDPETDEELSREDEEAFPLEEEDED